MKSRNRLRVLRAERRWNQVKTAKRARLSTTRFWRIENGYSEATPQERQRLARLFKVPVEEVFPPPIVPAGAPAPQEVTS